MQDTWIRTTGQTWSPNYSEPYIYGGTVYMFPSRTFLEYNFIKSFGYNNIYDKLKKKYRKRVRSARRKGKVKAKSNIIRKEKVTSNLILFTITNIYSIPSFLKFFFSVLVSAESPKMVYRIFFKKNLF